MGSGNHTLEFKLTSGNPTDTVNIQQFNKYFYDNIILMAPSVKSFGSDLRINDLMEYVDFHHNIMVFGSSDSRKVVRDLVNEFGVDFEDYGYVMNGGVPPKSSSQKAFKQENLAWSSDLFTPLERVFTKLDRPVLFEDGVGAVIDSKSNNMNVFPILRGSPGSFSFNKGAEDRKQTGPYSGNQLTLVAGYQTRYNQRVVVSGSLKMCSNQAMLATRDPKKGNLISSSPNYQLCTEMVEWNLQERGVLKVENVRHQKVGEEWTGANPENYKRQVDIQYFVDIYQK